MAADGADFSSCRRVPVVDAPVFASGDQEISFRMEGNAVVQFIGVPKRAEFGLPRLHVPYSRRSVIGRAGQKAAVRAECEARHRALVAI